MRRTQMLIIIIKLYTKCQHTHTGKATLVSQAKWQSDSLKEGNKCSFGLIPHYDPAESPYGLLALTGFARLKVEWRELHQMVAPNCGKARKKFATKLLLSKCKACKLIGEWKEQDDE